MWAGKPTAFLPRMPLTNGDLPASTVIAAALAEVAEAHCQLLRP
jgi:hypothetical protein